MAIYHKNSMGLTLTASLLASAAGCASSDDYRYQSDSAYETAPARGAYTNQS